jgi:hypothetical protein
MQYRGIREFRPVFEHLYVVVMHGTHIPGHKKRVCSDSAPPLDIFKKTWRKEED